MGNIRGLESHRWRMRVTLSSVLANAYLMPILSPLLKITETFGTEMIITMDFKTFGEFMAAVCEVDGGQKIAVFKIQKVDLNKEPTRITARHGITYNDEN